MHDLHLIIIYDSMGSEEDIPNNSGRMVDMLKRKHWEKFHENFPVFFRCPEI